jgi:type I restriction enzyme S subunit
MFGTVDKWQTLSFIEAVEINPSVPLERGEPYPFVDMQAVDPSARSVLPSELRPFSGGGARFQSGDTLMARITPCLENGKIARYSSGNHQPLAHGSTEFIVIRGREGVTNNDFVYYLTRSELVRGYAISQMTGTSGRQRVPTEALAHLYVPVPPLSEQRAIAAILGALDDKIELNRRMNETLEAIARAIFKSWFVDFDPVRAKMDGRWRRGQSLPGLPADLYDLFPDSFEDSQLGKIPSGWRIAPIGETVKVLGGSTPRTEESSFWDDGVHCFATPKDLSQLDGPIVFATERKITDSGLAQIGSGLLPVGTVLLSSRAPIGYTAIAETPVAVNQGIAAIVCGDALPNYYAYFWIKENLDVIVSNANGSTFLEISKGNLRRIEMLVPEGRILHRFRDLVVPLFRRLTNNLRESRTLAAIRDALLPKLISGEISVVDGENRASGVA